VHIPWNSKTVGRITFGSSGKNRYVKETMRTNTFEKATRESLTLGE
jgi:hypothetical protein